jgi:hypothetical protein
MRTGYWESATGRQQLGTGNWLLVTAAEVGKIMSLIDQRVASARRRLWVSRYLHYLGVCLVWAGLGWLLAVLIGKTFLHNLPLGYVALGAAGLAALAALIWLIITAEDPITAAVALDEAGRIKERLSSALYLRASRDAFSRAAVADAERTAATLRVRNVLPVRYPRRVNHAVVGWGAALLVLWLMPTFDVTGKLQAVQKKKEEIKKQQEIVARQVEQIQKAREQLQKADKPDVQLTRKLEELEQRMTDLSKQPEKMGVEAVKQTTSLKDEVRQQQMALQQQTDAMQAALSKLALANMDAQSQVGQFSRALAGGNFKESKEALQALQKRIQDAAKDPAKAAELAKQLDELAKALKEQAMSESLAKQLKAAGLSKDQMDKLAKALKEGKVMTADQMKDLQQAMKDQGLSDAQIGEMMQKIGHAMKAGQMANRLGQCMADAAAQLKQQGQGKSSTGQQGQKGQNDQNSDGMENTPGSGRGQGSGALADAGEQLGEMEAMQTELQSMQALLADLQGGPGQMGQCQGQYPGADNPNSRGPGMGALGQGEGGVAPIEKTPTALTKSKADTKWQPGKIIGEYFDDSQQVKGESRQELVDVVAAAERDAAKTIDEHKLPPQYDGPVRDYFSQLRQVGQGTGTTDTVTR